MAFVAQPEAAASPDAPPRAGGQGGAWSGYRPVYGRGGSLPPAAFDVQAPGSPEVPPPRAEEETTAEPAHPPRAVMV
eukprot:8871035-Alexandrium_andersonii.AAC.1